VGGNDSETAISDQRDEITLGQVLTSAREKRGLTREAVVKETHIPAHYLRMLESDDYRLISDELYLLPFLRKYAGFLELDQEDAAMRLVREVQRVDNNTQSARIDEPLGVVPTRRWRNWSKPAVFSGLIAVIIAAYIVQSRHNGTADGSSSAPILPSASVSLNAPSPVPSSALTTRSDPLVSAENGVPSHPANAVAAVPLPAPPLRQKPIQPNR
jgi:cytoskeletal protein RodZ